MWMKALMALGLASTVVCTMNNPGDNSFEEWRYIFEDRENTVLFFGMVEFVDALHGYVLSVKPAWIRYG
jgi:hypothetical protein